MRVGFDAKPMASAYGGIGQYVRSLFRVLPRLACDIEWVGFGESPSPPFGWEGGLPSMQWTGDAPSRVWNRPTTGGGTLDLFHGTNFKAADHGQRRTILTIHDVWLDRYPQYSRKMFGQKLAYWKTKHRIRRADHIISVSRFSAQEIQELYEIPSEHISVIYHGVPEDMYREYDPDQFQARRRELGMPSGPYLLFLGGGEPRKNHRALLEAYSRSPTIRGACSIVVIGDICARQHNVQDTAESLGLAGKVFCLGHVSREDLRRIYSHAEAFLFPSLYEGFGIPLLEAMACGTVVVTSSCAAMPEISGGAALLVDPREPEHLKASLERLLGDSMLRKALRKKGEERVRQFSWELAATETLAVYRDIVSR